MSQLKKFCKNIGVDLYPKQLEILEQFYGGQFRELVAVLGRRSGKDIMSAVIALRATDFLTKLEGAYSYYKIATGNPIYVMWLAPTAEMARVSWSNVKELIHNSAYLQRDKTKVLKDEIIFYVPEGEIRLLITSQGSQKILGKRLFTLILNDAACYPNLNRTLSALIPATADFIDPRTGYLDSKIIATSAPRFAGDEFHNLFSEDVPSRLSVQYATWEMNPKMTKKYLEKEFNFMDSDQFRADFWAEFIPNPGNQTISLRLPGRQIETLKRMARQKSYEQSVDINYVDLIRDSISMLIQRGIDNG